MIRKRWLLTGIIAVGAVGIFIVFQTPWVSMALCRHYLSSRPGLVVKKISVKAQQFGFPGHFHFDNIDMMLLSQGQELRIHIPSMDVSGWQQWFGPEKRLMVDLTKARVRFASAVMDDLDIHATLTPAGISGLARSSLVSWDKWQAADVSTFLMVRASGVEARAIKCRAYDGQLTGKTTLYFGTGLPVISGEVFIDKLDVVRLKEISPLVTEKIDGLVSGVLRFQADTSAIHTLDVSLEMPEGGFMNAELLSALTQYLPASREKKRLDALIRRGGKLGMEVVTLTLKGGEHGVFSGQMQLHSREINLELNLTHEIITDGTTASLWEYGKKFLQ